MPTPMISRAPQSPTLRRWLERLEDRDQPAILTVTNVADSGAGSLRQAILDSNASVGVVDTIAFAIGTGPQTIAPNSALPNVTDPVVIDGTTQPGFAGSPIIELTGLSAGANANGLRITGGNTTVRGLVVNGFSAQQVVLQTLGGNLVAGSYVGTDLTGTAAVWSGPGDSTRRGVYILNSSGNTIGGTTAADRNIISGNRTSGIAIYGIGSSNNIIRGNYIGTNAAGTAALGNLSFGIEIAATNCDNNVIGGTALGAGNVISGTIFGYAVYTSSATALGTVIQGNLVGTNAAGTALIPNKVGVSAGLGAIIGGTAPGAGNLIWGNDGDGISISADGNTVTGNVVRGNAGYGIGIFGSGSSPTGSTVTGNLIEGNGGDGILLYGSNVSNNVIGGLAAGAGNVIRGNGENGVWVREGDRNSIRGNVISANGENGILLSGYPTSADWNVVQGNMIGTDATGTLPDGNGGLGIWVWNGAHNSIGGTGVGERNVISANGNDGVTIGGAEAPGQYNVVQGNFIGTDITGTVALGNNGTGVSLFQNAQFNTVSGNVIAGNTGRGVFIGGNLGVTGNVATGNWIGTDKAGTLDLGNGSHGVWIANTATNNVIGGLATGAGNVIAFNGRDGVYIGNAPPGNPELPGAGNAILSNLIYGNHEIGIDLGPDDDVTPNDAFGHVGPNNFQNYPVLTVAYATGSTLTVRGTLTSTPDTDFTLQFFSNPAADPSGHGQGQTLLATVVVRSDATGVATFDVTFASATAPGEFVTATATDSDNNTSEFSASVVVVANAPPTADDDAFTVNPGSGPNGLTVLANDTTAPDSGEQLSITTFTQPSVGGQVAFQGGVLTFTPALGFSGVATFTYTITDGRGGTDTATVSVTVQPSATPQPGRDVMARSAESGAWVVLHSTGSAFDAQAFGGWNPTAGWRDVATGDFNGDGRTDVAGRTSDGHWWVGLSNGSTLATTHWGSWNEAAGWKDVSVGDFNGDGRMDIAGRTSDGHWWVGLSTGAAFTTTHWGSWNEAAGWRDVRFADFNGDGKADITGRTSDGHWWVSTSTGSAFVATHWGSWNEAAGWKDVGVGDFNGDGKVDIAGRTSDGNWWVGLSTGTTFDTTHWGGWNEAAGWRDVQFADFDGDGQTDVAGRTSDGHWWVSTSTGSALATTHWGGWNETAGWQNVGVGDFNGDGKADIAGRTSDGNWWVGLSTSTAFNTTHWGTFPVGGPYVDVRRGYFAA